MLSAVDNEVDGDDLEELRRVEVRVLVLDKEFDQVCWRGSLGNSRGSVLVPVMDGRLLLPFCTGSRRGVLSLLSAWWQEPFCQRSPLVKAVPPCSGISVNERENGSALY